MIKLLKVIKNFKNCYLGNKLLKITLFSKTRLFEMRVQIWNIYTLRVNAMFRSAPRFRGELEGDLTP